MLGWSKLEIRLCSFQLELELGLGLSLGFPSRIIAKTEYRHPTDTQGRVLSCYLSVKYSITLKCTKSAKSSEIGVLRSIVKGPAFKSSF